MLYYCLGHTVVMVSLRHNQKLLYLREVEIQSTTVLRSHYSDLPAQFTVKFIKVAVQVKKKYIQMSNNALSFIAH